MAFERYGNRANTTLNGAINNSQTSITVVSGAAPFPQSAQFRIRIEDEISIVTAGAGTTSWTVTRGAEGTTAASHADTTPVIQSFTAGALDNVRANMRQIGVYASLPSSANGQLADKYEASDSPYDFVHNGSIWVPYYRRVPVTIPGTTGENLTYTWINQQSSAVVANTHRLTLSKPSTASGSSIYGTPLSAAAYTITMGALYHGRAGNFTSAGIAIYKTSDGKLINHSLAHNNTNQANYGANRYTNVTTYLSTITGSSLIVNSPELWLRIQETGSNRLYFFSKDGIQWIQNASTSLSDHFATPDKCGPWLENGAGVGDIWLDVFHFTITYP